MAVATNMPREARALLDAISVGESGGSDDPYNILYGGGSMVGLPNRAGYYGFPEWAGQDNSHAAGRYQFEPATWLGIVPRFSPGTPDFRNPADQDWGAWFLAQEDFKRRSGSDLLERLKSGALVGIGSTLKATWTSMSDSTFPVRFVKALAAIPADESAPSSTEPSIPSAPPTPSAPQGGGGSSTSAHPAVTVGASAGLGGAVVGILINHGLLTAADAPYAITIAGAISGWLMYRFTWLRVPT